MRIIKKMFMIGLLIMISVSTLTGLSGCASETSEQGPSNKNETSIEETISAAYPQVADNTLKETDFSMKEDNVELANREPVPDTKEFSNVVITVAAPSERMADFLHKDGQEWAKRTGAKLIVLEISFSQIFEQVAAEILSGSCSYDIILYPHYLSGDIMGTGKLVPLEELIDISKANNSYQQGGVEWDSYFPQFKGIYSWYNGHVYSLPVDGDVFQVAYRKDLWIKYKDEFKSEYNYELRPDDPKFPETWDQYYDIAEFFNQKDGLYGTVDINIRSRASAWHFLTRYFSYLKKDGMYNGDAYFSSLLVLIVLCFLFF